jgi:hypothetical protein
MVGQVAETMANQRQGPALADVRAPWDHQQPLSMVEAFRVLPATVNYMSKFGFYWAPETVDIWSYRGQLRQLDWLALRALKSQGAMTPEELAEWLNRDRRIRTSTAKTGIDSMSVATARDWIACASRRALVLPWTEVDGSEGHRWGLSDYGRSATRSPLGSIAARVPVSPLATLVVGGGLAVAAGWLQQHQTLLALLIVFGALALYVGVILLLSSFSQKRSGPGVAVVWIETSRIAGKEVPALVAKRGLG